MKRNTRKKYKGKKKLKTLHKDVFSQLEEIGTKRRTMKRTSKIKDELSVIDYVPDDRKNSVKGKTYRSVRDEFNEGMKRKTKKTRKNRRLK